MSKGQKKVADCVLADSNKCAFMTAAELGRAAGVSESTVVRFPAALGLSGYPQFQRQLAALVQDKIKSFDKIDITQGDMSDDLILANVLSADAKKIEYTLQNIDKKAFHTAVDDILHAQNVYIIGVRSCEPLAHFLAYYLKVIRSGVSTLNVNDANELFEQMIHVCEKDVVIGISFPRYSMRTLKAMEFANSRSARIIAITDSKHSPMNMYSSCNLFAVSEMASIVDSMAAPLSLMNALIVAMCVRKNKEVVKNLENLRTIMDNYSFEGNDEINMLDEDVMRELNSMSERKKTNA